MLQIVLLLLFYASKNVSSHKSFIIPFQSLITGTDSPSTDEWIEFTNQVPNSKELTACHWIRTKYFNKYIPVNLWSYCTIESVDEESEDTTIESDDEVAKNDLELETIESVEPEAALEGSIIDSKKTRDIDDVLDDSITENDGNSHTEDEPIVEKAD